MRYYEEPIRPAAGHVRPVFSGAPAKKSREHRSMRLWAGARASPMRSHQTAFATLREEGHERLVLSINTVGDRESMNRFIRELSNYYRKHIASLPTPCRALLKKSPLELLRCDHEKCKALADEAPKSMSFLGDESRRHFKEVLEFLEELEIPYRIDHTLLGNRIFATETLFEIHETPGEFGSDDGGTQRGGTEAPRCLCSGVRYNNLKRSASSAKSVRRLNLPVLGAPRKLAACVSSRSSFPQPAFARN